VVSAYEGQVGGLRVATLAIGFAALVGLGCQPAKVQGPAGATGGAPGAAGGGPGAGQGPGPGAGGNAGGAPDAGTIALPDAGAVDLAPPSTGTCAAETFEASPVAVDLVFVIDQSPSMLFMIGGRTKWALAREALGRFLRDPGSAGLGVGFQYFPTPTTGASCANDEDCGFILTCKGGRCMYPFSPFPSCAVADYTRLNVPIGLLPANEGALTQSMMREPYANWGSSPMGIAAQGVFKFLRTRLQTVRDRQVAVVLVTDGVPSNCFYGWIQTPDIVAGLGAELRMQPPIRTFVIGLFSDRMEDRGGEGALTEFARAGGTNAPFFVRPPDDVAGRFVEALNQIRAASLPCEYVIPADKAGALDFQKVNLHYKGPSREEDVPYVGNAARCDPMRGGWYYDVDPATSTMRPTRVIACPATCAEFKSQMGKSQVSLAYGCKTRTID
jgi:hypothetical protein